MKELICDICKKAFKWRRAARDHMKKEHNVERFFCIVVACGVSQRTAADLKHHYEEAYNHDTGKQQAPEESGELKGGSSRDPEGSYQRTRSDPTKGSPHQ